MIHNISHIVNEDKEEENISGMTVQETIINALEMIIEKTEPDTEFDRRLQSIFNAHLENETAITMATELVALIDTL